MDFKVYYEAVRGNFQGDTVHYDDRACHIFTYPTFTRWAWAWTLPFTFETAFTINAILYTVFFSLTFLWIHKHAKSKRQKLLVISIFIAAIQWFRQDLAGGNIVPFLALLVLSPVGCILAGCFKPFCFGFAFIHFFLYAASGRIKPPDKIHYANERLDIPFIACWNNFRAWMEKIVCYFRAYDSLF